MTPEKAIEELSSDLKTIEEMMAYIRDFENGNDLLLAYKTNRMEALEAAIFALKEIQQYREVGTVEECRKAVEKQRPKKPVCKPKPYNESVGFNEEWFCPSCGAYIGYFYEGMDEPEQMEYCNECGQHIARDWSDENEDE